MTIVGKNKLDHPALGTAGGSALHGQIENLWQTVSDNLPSRWFLSQSVAVNTTTTFDHNIQVPFADLRVFIYIKGASSNTRATDFTASGWVITANAANPQTKIDIRTPTSGGPFDFYVFIIHAPVSDKLDVAGGTLTGALTLAADPTQALHAATKQYVDSVAEGLDVKASVKRATTANITLSGVGTNYIDGSFPTAGDRILVKNQTNQYENGIYIVASGSWSRASDVNTWSELIGAFVFIEEGTTLADTGWVCTVNSGGTLGTTPVTWTQFSGAGVLSGDNSTITVSGNTISAKLDTSSNTLASSASGIKVKDGSLSNQHIAAGANIDGSKINPTFTTTVNISGNCYPTGTMSAYNVTAQNMLNAYQANVSDALTANSISTATFQELTAIAAPNAPASGKARVYLGTDGEVYSVNDQGVSKKLGGGSVASSAIVFSDDAPLWGSRNLLINGGLRILQSSRSSTDTIPSSGAIIYGADRWGVLSTGSTVVKTKGSNYIQLSQGTSGNTGCGLVYRMEGEHMSVHQGKTVTLSFKTSTNLAQNVVINILTPNTLNTFSSNTTQYATTIAIPTAETKSTYTFQMPYSSNGLYIQILAQNCKASSTYVQFKELQLEIGNTATAFEYVRYEQDLINCQRYYFYKGASHCGARTLGTDDGSIYVWAMTPVVMRAVPKITHSTGTMTANGMQKNINARNASSSNVFVYENELHFTATTATTGIGIYRYGDAELPGFIADADF